MKHTCNICGTNSDVSDFYRGVTSRCKECHKVKVRENRANRIDYYRAYDVGRFQTDPKVKDRHRRYQLTSAGKASAQASRKRWMEVNAEKRAAHIILGNRLRDGKITKPNCCETCGATDCRIHGHHHDYSLPLDVKWLCPKCHKREHQ